MCNGYVSGVCNAVAIGTGIQASLFQRRTPQLLCSTVGPISVSQTFREMLGTRENLVGVWVLRALKKVFAWTL